MSGAAAGTDRARAVDTVADGADAGRCGPGEIPVAAPVPSATAERLIILALAAAVLFNPPLLRIFGRSEAVLGLPLLYVYIFLAWGAVIALTAVILDRDGGR